MKLSQRGEYAIQALLVLGMYHGPEVIRIKEIANQQNIPRRFLEQILHANLASLGASKAHREAIQKFIKKSIPQISRFGANFGDFLFFSDEF